MKLALITGGSRGLGAALVETYLQAGWEVREFSRSGTSAIHRDLDLANPDSIQQAIKSVQQEFASAKLEELLLDKATQVYSKKEAELGEPLMRELERVLMLRVVDEYWMDQIDAMNDMKQGIGLRAYAQTDPVVAYKKEGYEMFENMVAAIQEETLRRLFLVRLRPVRPLSG